MSVVITGGGGYLGVVLAAALRERGYTPVLLDAAPIDVSALPGLAGVHTAQADIRDAAALRAALVGAVTAGAGAIEAVVHLAAIVGDAECKKDEARARAVNVDGTHNVIAIARELGARRFIFASSASNYGVSAGGEATEETPVVPTGLYAETKIAGEQATLAAAAPDFEPVVLRFATLHGSSPRMMWEAMINAMTRDAMREGGLEIYAPSAWRPFVHVRDVAGAILACLEGPAAAVSGQVFNVVTENMRKGEVAEAIGAALGGLNITTKDVPDPRDYRVSSEKMQRVLGFQASRSVAQGIDELVMLVRQEALV